MKTEQPVLITSITAAVAIKIHEAVGYDGTLAGSDDRAMGIAMSDASAGEQVPVAVSGIVLAKTSPVEGYTPGNFCKASTSENDEPGLVATTGTFSPQIIGRIIDYSINGDPALIRIKLF